MRYCSRCIVPDTRPDVRFDAQDVCSACRAHDEKQHQVDWSARRQAFEALVDRVKRLKRRYDCLIPVSGGKDSTWQVVTCLQHGLHPLTVTWKPPAQTAIGAANLENLVSLGVDHLAFQINPQVEKKFLYQSLVRYGATAIPMHMAMFNIPLTLAAALDIPLLVWGENSADEYGGVGDESRGHRMDGRWLKRYGVTHGTTARDWISKELTEQELAPYFGPGDEALARKDIHAVFLGYYFNWDPVATYAVAAAHGFRARPEGPKVGYYPFADIDDEFISIHHYLKWYKFGFTRLFDNLSLEIRNGRMARDEAIALVRERGVEVPHEDIERFCAFTGMPTGRFFEIIERFRNPAVWTRRDGTWRIEGFLVPDWKWEEEVSRAAHTR
ncbi:MAG: N-acetyl sugar amidotransferase [Candidatus Omnitrophica bacterium]|nr:N-acetyl sugar amidotransferase [Candidatus Omnitrophota bacterium]